ncbi:MAG TPA: hypothetical protein VM689_09755 [Aliidongia sp.]|nr:hypothetical protein [Aliidongia sp.]
MEGLMLLLDALAVVLLVYWVMANDDNPDKTTSKGLFAFVDSMKAAAPVKKPSFRPNVPPPQPRPRPPRDLT